MKNIDRTELRKAVKEGRANSKDVFPVISKEPTQIDDREPLDRMADELVRFTEVIQGMNQTQATEIAKVLQTILSVVERIAKIDSVKPTEWLVKVTARDNMGLIKDVKLVANDNKTLLQ